MLINIVSRLGSIAIGYLTLIYINSIYTFDVYGEYILFVTYGLIISSLAVFGLDTAIIAHSKLNSQRSPYLVFIVLFYSLATALLFSYMFSVIIDYEYGIYLTLFTLSASANRIIQTIFLLNDRNNTYAISVYVLEQLLFLLVLYLYRDGVQSNIIHAATTSYIVSFILLFFYAWVLGLIRISTTRKSVMEFKDIYKKALYFFGSNLVETFANTVDKILIGKLLSTSFLGVYSNLDKLSRLTLSVFTSISPIIQRKFSTSHGEFVFTSYYRRMAITCGVISLPLTFGLYYFRDFVLTLLSKELIIYNKLFVLLLLLRLVQYATGFKAVALKMTGLSRFDFYAKVFKLVISSSTIVILSNLYDESGFIAALLLTTIMYVIVQYIYLRRYHKIRLFEFEVLYGILFQVVIFILTWRFEGIYFILMEICYFMVMLKYIGKKYNMRLSEVL